MSDQAHAADAEAATIPFVHRFNLTLPHYFDIDPLKIVAENKLDRLEKWMKVLVFPVRKLI